MPEGSSSTAVTARWINCHDDRSNGSLLGPDMRARTTPNVLARSPKTHPNPTINRVLPGHNRTFLLHQQTTAKSFMFGSVKSLPKGRVKGKSRILCELPNPWVGGACSR